MATLNYVVDAVSISEVCCMDMVVVVVVVDAVSTINVQRLMSHTLTGVEGAKTYNKDTFTFTADTQRQLRALRQVTERTREIITTP
jgi:hypothetical protein